MSDTSADARARKRARRREREDPDYLRWVHGQPCIVCGKPGEAHHSPARRRGLDWHDRKTVPLCSLHHTGGVDAIHYGVECGTTARFEAYHGVDISAEIERLNREYDER